MAKLTGAVGAKFHSARVIVESVNASQNVSVSVDLVVAPDTNDMTDVVQAFLFLVDEAESGFQPASGYGLAPGGRIDVSTRTLRADTRVQLRLLVMRNRP